MVSQTEKDRGPSFVDLVEALIYVERSYGGAAEVHISTDEDNPRDALLCITCPRVCKIHNSEVGGAFVARKVPYSQLHRVQSVLSELMYELIEELDGSCARCQERAARLN